MIELGFKIPRVVGIAISGGVDSVAIVDFLKRNHDVRLYYFNHGTDYGNRCEDFVDDYAAKNQLPIFIGRISDKTVPNGQSQEEYWRNCRYEFFHSFDMPIITGHHLDDNIETWIWSSLHGKSKTIPIRNRNVIRPFMLNHKYKFKEWCERRNVEWLEDPSNENTDYIRNYIRHQLMPHALVLNPGIAKVIYKKLKQNYEREKIDTTQSI